MGYEKEPVYLFSCSPGDGNNVSVINIARSLNADGISTRTHFPLTASRVVAEVRHRRMTGNHESARRYTNGQAENARGGVAAYLHSLDVIQEILTHFPELSRANPGRKSVWTQELGLSLLTLMPQVAKHLFGDIYIAAPDLVGKTQGKLNAHSIAKKLGATMIYAYRPGHELAVARGVKAKLVDPYLPGYNLKETEKLTRLASITPLLSHTIKEAGSAMPKEWKQELVRPQGFPEHPPATSIITPTHIEQYMGIKRFSRSPRPGLAQIYEDMADDRITHMTTYSSEMAQVFLALGYVGSTREVSFLESRGYWEQVSQDGVVNTLGALWSISSLTWNDIQKTFSETRLTPSNPLALENVIGRGSVAEALELV